MIILQRTGRWVVLLALVLSGIITVAQDTSEVNIQGSGIVLPVIEAIAESSDDVAVTTDVTGTDAAFAAFCAGEADITAVSRVINIEEERACSENGVEFYELQLGYSIPAFITHPDDSTNSCLTGMEISTLLAPSAVSNINSWSDLQNASTPAQGEEGSESTDESTDDSLSFFLPLENTLNYVALDDIVEGVGFRSDAVLDTADAIATAVAGTPNSFGLVSLADLPEGAEVRILDFSADNDPQTCSSPDATSVENGSYAASARLMVYVNAASAEDYRPLLDLLIAEEAASVIADNGYTPATENARATNQQIIAGELGTGREFSRYVTAFEPPEVLFGEFTVAGSAAAYTLLDSISNTVTQQQENLTINLDLTTSAEGIASVCAGEAALSVVRGSAEDAEDSEAFAACAENDIATVTMEIGKQPAVLIRNAENDFASCLTLDQITNIWAASDEAPTNWQQVDSSMPDLDMTLFASPPAPSNANELLLEHAGEPMPPIRADVESEHDALYRAAAVANVSGALTFMSYAQYERVLENGQEGIAPVEVDGGNGCVAPELENFLNDTYPLQRTMSLLIAQDSLADVNVQTFLWEFFNDLNYQMIRTAGFVGLDRAALALMRDRLEDEFETATEIVSQRGLEESAPVEETPEAEDTGDAETE